jgi:hypothetical protein
MRAINVYKPLINTKDIYHWETDFPNRKETIESIKVH